MANLIQDGFKIDINVLRFFGLYPSNFSSVLVKVKSILLYFLTYLLVSILMLMGNIQVKFVVIYLCQIAGFAFKVLCLVFDGQRIMNCVNYIEQPDFQPFDLEEKKIKDECVYVCHTNSAAYFYGILSCVLQFKGHKLRLNCWLPVDPTTNLFYYGARWIFLLLGIRL